MTSRTKEQRKLEKLAKGYGFHLHRRTNHMIFRNAQGRQVVTSCSASDNARTIKNFESQLRRTAAICC